MNSAHLHLLVNHLPIFGSLFGMLLLAYALLGRRQEFIRISFVIFGLSAVSALAAYVTGEPAEELLEHAVGVTGGLVEQHKEAALLSLVLIVILGLSCCVWLFVYRSRALPSSVTLFALVLALAVAGSMAWTAHLGGQIRHSELRQSGAATAEAAAQHPR
jgi:uncharacterized membrane protein